MAQKTRRAGGYLPDLEKCLSGELRALSWSEVALELERNRQALPGSRALSFLGSPEAKSLLLQTVPSFAKPSAQARTNLDSRTAAIHVATQHQAAYSIEQISEDALYLSKTVGLNEIEALRITVLEWQQRPAARLNNGFSETEMASIKSALDINDTAMAVSLPTKYWPGNDAQFQFDTKDQRRARQLVLYFRETTSVVGTRLALMEIALQSSTEHRQDSTSIAGEFDELLTNIVAMCDISVIEKNLSSCIESFQFTLNENSTHTSKITDDYNDDETLHEVSTEETLKKLKFTMELILLHMFPGEAILPACIVSTWLETIKNASFFLLFEPLSMAQVQLLNLVQSLSAIVTAAILSPMVAIASIADDSQIQILSTKDKPYILDVDQIGSLNKLFLSLSNSGDVPAAPAAFAWALIVHAIMEQAESAKEMREAQHEQRTLDQGTNFESNTGRRMSSSSTGSAQQSTYEELADAINASSDIDEVVHFMIYKAVEQSKVFDVISALSSLPSSGQDLVKLVEIRVLQDLVYIALSPLGYSPEALSAHLSILSSSTNKDIILEKKLGEPDLDLRTELLRRSVGDELLDTTFSRFPYESLPMLTLCEALAGSDMCTYQDVQEIILRLQEMKHFTESVSSAFSAYHTTSEEEDRNWVVLEQDVGMLNRTGQKRLSGMDGSVMQHLVVPAKTIGRMISEERPPVVTWSVQYSALAYFGAWLGLYRNGGGHDAVSHFESSEQVTAATVSLLNAILQRVLQYPVAVSEEYQRTEYAMMLIEEIQTDISDGSDLIAVISDILEHELAGLQHTSRSSPRKDIVVACLKFLRIMLQVYPHRAWSAISRSSLVKLRGGNGGALLNLTAIEGGQEDCSLFEESSLLYRDLVEKALKHAGRRPTGNESHRSTNAYTTSSESMPEHFVRQVLLAFTKIMVEVFVASCKWRKEFYLTKMRISTSLCQTFESIILDIYGTDDNADLMQKLTRSFSSSATYLVESFLSPPGDTTMTEPLLHNLFAGLGLSDGSTIRDEPVIVQTQATLSVSLVFLQTRVFLGRPRSALEQQLFDAMPLLVRLAVRSRYINTALALITHLLNTGSSAHETSLLGCLGSQSTYCFLEELSKLKRGHDSERQVIDAWSLAATLVSSSQQWVAVMLLTGCPPKPPTRPKAETSEDRSGWTMRGNSFVQEALDRISHIEQLAPETASAMLRFLVRAQTSWTWSACSIQSHPDFLASIISYVSDYVVNVDDPLNECYHNRNVALILELCTVYLHHARTARDSASIKKMAPMMTWLTNNVTDMVGYNLSLHSNLSKNFSARYGPLTLMNFKRTQLGDAHLGEQYVYNSKLADKVLSPDQAWSRPGTDKTFFHEFRRANLNLSLVESQVYLLQSFKGFCVEHCAYFVQDRETQKTMSHIAQNCLKANSQPRPPEKMFDSIYQSRADFALALMQHLVHARAKGSDFVALLPSTWDVIQAGTPSYESAITNDDLPYYRTCLTILILALQFHIGKRVRSKKGDSNSDNMARKSDPSSPLILDIAAMIVAEGLRSVTSTMYESKRPGDDIDDRDLSLLLNLLQTILRLPSLPHITAQLSECFIFSDVARSCLMLYSWSQITAAPSTAGNTASAILALRFLVSFSSLPAMAEALAIDGVLNRMSVTRLTQSLMSCQDGASQFDKRSSCQILYLIWVTGLLPLCLNLLHSVGRAMAGEISGFLNQFPEQLRLASKTFAKGNVTLLMAEEASTLALISHALQSYRQAGPSAGVDLFDIEALIGYDEHKNTLAEDIEDLLGLGKKFKEKIIVTNEREVTWQRTREEVLEQKISNSLRSAVTCLRG